MGRFRIPRSIVIEDYSGRTRRSKRIVSSSGENLESAAAGHEINEWKRARFHCNYCNKDITGKIRIKCAVCPDFDLCLECFSVGAEITPHNSNHPYRVMDKLSFALLCPDWNADKEMLLLEGLEMYGFGNWAEVAVHVGTHGKDQCVDHYNTAYMNSPCFPLPGAFCRTCLILLERIEMSLLRLLKSKRLPVKGIHPPQPNSLTSFQANPPPFTAEDEDRELVSSASLQYTAEDIRPHRPRTRLSSRGSTSVSSSGCLDRTLGNSNMRPSSVFEAGSSSNNPAETKLPSIVPTDDSFIDMSSATTTDRIPAKTGGVTDDSCIICYDAPHEGPVFLVVTWLDVSLA